MKLKLDDGMHWGTAADGKKQCRGARMGRPNVLPLNLAAPIALNLCKLPMSGDYERKPGGAYWGAGGRTGIMYVAYAPDTAPQIQVFVRAASRAEAKTRVRYIIPGALFRRL